MIKLEETFNSIPPQDLNNILKQGTKGHILLELFSDGGYRIIEQEHLGDYETPGLLIEVPPLPTTSLDNLTANVLEEGCRTFTYIFQETLEEYLISF